MHIRQRRHNRRSSCEDQPGGIPRDRSELVSCYCCEEIKRCPIGLSAVWTPPPEGVAQFVPTSLACSTSIARANASASWQSSIGLVPLPAISLPENTIGYTASRWTTRSQHRHNSILYSCYYKSTIYQWIQNC